MPGGAREIALEFDEQSASPADERPSDQEQTWAAEPPVWPKCPQCGAPRTTQCPVCETTGSEFPAADGDSSGVLRLLCSTCDEPFIPQYPRHCEWCGHEFADGYSVGPSGDFAAGELSVNARVVMLLLGVLALLGMVAGWLIYLFR